MPRSRSRGGTRMPRAGAETTRPAMLISPDVGCSSPATQRKVVVLPQPDGPSSTTISPAGTAKLTPSIAGRPIANCFRKSVTSGCAVMTLLASWKDRSLPVTERLVPICDPGGMQLHIVVELGKPDLNDLGIKSFGIDRRLLQRGEVAEFLDHKSLPLLRKAPVEEQFCGIGMRRGFWNPGRVGIDRRALGWEENLDRRAVLLLGIDCVIEQRSHRDFAAHHRVRHRRARG